jgi:hypothetical protein
MKSTTFARRCVPAALSLALLAGCSSAGLSPRETGRQNYSSFVYSMYDLPGATAGASGDASRRPGRLVLPARVAVAQMGEVAPPNAFLDKLRGRPDLFTRVEAISGIPGNFQLDPDPSEAGSGVVGPASHNSRAAAVGGDARRDLAAMQRMARDMGMDHLLVLGGTVDHSTHGNALSLLDLTIVGAFVAPSKEINARATAAGAMIDLDSGKVVLTASADASKGGLAATATQEGAQLGVLRRARDEVVNKLGDSLLAECKRRQAAGAS